MSKNNKSIAQIISIILIISFNQYAFSQNVNYHAKDTWFETMKDATDKTLKEKNTMAPMRELWSFLRLTFNNPNDLMEMSWEERDSVWASEISLDDLGKNYKRAYLVS